MEKRFSMARERGINPLMQEFTFATLEQRARAFATMAHRGQTRKYTGDPYIVHPEAVVKLVASVPHTEAMLAAAWLHDVVEDTPVTLDYLRAEFGVEVAALVEQLTDVSRPWNGNRAIRKAMDREHLAFASPEAKTVKLADLIDNSRSIIERDPGFARTYVAEKRLLLEVLWQGDPILHGMATRIVRASGL